MTATDEREDMKCALPLGRKTDCVYGTDWMGHSCWACPIYAMWEQLQK